MAGTHSVYVIVLGIAVLEDRKFRERNPDYVAGKPCAYVGMTGKSPDERFMQHKDGYKANRFANRFGLYLARRQFERLNPMSYEECAVAEVELAAKLRKKGWAVWQA